MYPYHVTGSCKGPINHERCKQHGRELDHPGHTYEIGSYSLKLFLAFCNDYMHMLDIFFYKFERRKLNYMYIKDLDQPKPDEESGGSTPKSRIPRGVGGRAGG